MSNSMNDMSNFYLIFSVIQAIAVSAYANFRSSVSSAIKDQNFGVFFWGGREPHPSHKTDFTTFCSYAALFHFLHSPGHL